MARRISRDEAWSLLTEWVESPSLRRHCLAVEAAMEAYARREADADVELWRVTGLLHDADWERFPDMDTGHPRRIMEELRDREAPEEMVRAIGSHAPYLGISRDSTMEKTLFAVDELSGFLVACAHVRPQGISGLTPKSVNKKLKQPTFAAAVDRDELRSGAEDLGVDFDEHVRCVVAALEERAEELGIASGGEGREAGVAGGAGGPPAAAGAG
ncbi:MAG TPA: HDIG domain-containing protein [Solirubrobacteraceae bacterium]|nr:HDIG domain-containing protein [Solirubrobacteraceae bacterium]